MSKEYAVWLHSVGVVIMAEFHNPSILNKDFLVMEKIVPKEWNIAKNIITPAVSVIEYTNGTKWLVDQQRLEITEKCDSPFQEYEDSQVHDLATSYVKKLPYVPYRSLGLNYTLSIIREDPLRWLTERFLKVDPYGGKLYMMPRFTMDLGGVQLNLNFGSGSMSHGQDSPASSIIINCNLHHGGQSSSDSICDKIHRWTDSRKNIASVLDNILESQ